MLCYTLCFLPYLQFGSATRTVCTWIAEKWQQGSKRKLCKLLAHLWALLWIIGSKVITIHALFAVIWMKTKFTVQNVCWLDFQTWSWIGLFIFLNSIFKKVEFVWKYLHICGFISLDLHQYTSGYGQFNHNCPSLRKSQAKMQTFPFPVALRDFRVWCILLEKPLVRVILKITLCCADYIWISGRKADQSIILQKFILRVH